MRYLNNHISANHVPVEAHGLNLRFQKIATPTTLRDGGIGESPTKGGNPHRTSHLIPSVGDIFRLNTKTL